MHIHIHLLSFFHTTFVRRLIGALTGSMIALSGYHAFESTVEMLRDAPSVKADVQAAENENALSAIAERAKANMNRVD